MGLDNLIEAAYYFISLNPDPQNLQKQTFRDVLSYSEVQTVFALSPVATFLVSQENELPESR